MINRNDGAITLAYNNKLLLLLLLSLFSDSQI